MIPTLKLFSLPSMDQIVDALKYVSAVFAIVAPAFSAWASRGRNPARELEERDGRIDAFFTAGGSELNPFRMESAFGAAVGHTRLDAQEIPLILRQRKPTSFMTSYLRVRDYLAPSSDGRSFELRSAAAYPLLRQALTFTGLACYALFGIASSWLLFIVAPKLAVSHAWTQLGLTVAHSAMFAVAGGFFLIFASHLHWAKKLYDSQNDA